MDVTSSTLRSSTPPASWESSPAPGTFAASSRWSEASRSSPVAARQHPEERAAHPEGSSPACHMRQNGTRDGKVSLSLRERGGGEGVPRFFWASAVVGVYRNVNSRQHFLGFETGARLV